MIPGSNFQCGCFFDFERWGVYPSYSLTDSAKRDICNQGTRMGTIDHCWSFVKAAYPKRCITLSQFFSSVLDECPVAEESRGVKRFCVGISSCLLHSFTRRVINKNLTIVNITHVRFVIYHETQWKPNLALPLTIEDY